MSNAEEHVDSNLLVWPGQAEFLEAESPFIGLFTGAGYGKSAILARRAIMDHAKQDGWWTQDIAANWKDDHLKMIVGAPHDRYLTVRLVPAFRGELGMMENLLGRPLRKNTGRNRDGWFGSKAERKQEMRNAVDFYFYPLHSPDSAVATDAAGLYWDEITMCEDVETWNRSTMRVRDPRANSMTIACCGTPEEDHFIYEMLVDPETGIARPDCTVITESSIMNPVLPMHYFERAGEQMSHTFKRMQVMGEWVRGAGGQRFANVFLPETHVKKMNIGPGTVSGRVFCLGWDPGFRTGSVLIAYKHPRGFWCIVDEIVIQDMTTEEVCDLLLRKGYNASNIKYIGMDPQDANKRRSTSKRNDLEIVYEKLRVRPKMAKNPGRRGELRVRLDAIAEMFSTNRLLISDKLTPSRRTDPGLINSLLNFATKKMQTDNESFKDQPTPETLEKWKHAIDALHYIMVYNERGTYSKVDRSKYGRMKHGRR